MKNQSMNQMRYNNWLFNYHTKLKNRMHSASLRLSSRLNDEDYRLQVLFIQKMNCEPCECFISKVKFYNHFDIPIKRWCDRCEYEILDAKVSTFIYETQELLKMVA